MTDPTPTCPQCKAPARKLLGGRTEFQCGTIEYLGDQRQHNIDSALQATMVMVLEKKVRNPLLSADREAVLISGGFAIVAEAVDMSKFEN